MGASFPLLLWTYQSPQLPCSPPLSVWGADAITILELLDWPCCRMLPVSHFLEEWLMCSFPRAPGFQKEAQEKSALHPHIYSLLSGISSHSISGSAVISTHTHERILNTETQMHTRLRIPLTKEGERWPYRGSLSALFCICQMGASLKELCWFLS